jgi:hypothetical protein
MLLIVILAIVLIFVAVKVYANQPAPKRATVQVGELYSLQVHGIAHKNEDGSDRQKIIRKCRAGEPVRFELEPQNPFDPHAIKVCRMNGEQIGYVEKDMAAQTGELMRAGRIAKASIEEVYEFHDDGPRRGVCIQVEIAKA